METFLPFTEKTMMADVIHHDYRLIPIISRFGVTFGFGNKSIADVCASHNINTWFFLEIINSYHNENYFPQEKLKAFSTILFIDYLSNTHSYYLDAKVPEIQGYIDMMEQKSSPKNHKNIKLLNDFFKEYKNELIRHLKVEDEEVFPYIRSLEKSLETGTIDEKILKAIKEESIEKYASTHENVEEKLSDLKNLIIKFLPPVLCMDLCQKLLTELFRLESDLKNHARIEDNVLVPMVKKLEQKILEVGATS